jgi:hypothetical protein
MKFFIIPVSFLIALIFSCSENDLTNNPNTKKLTITAKNIDTVFIKDSLWIKTNSLIWIYDTSSVSSILKLFIKGTTNSKSLGIESFGDGLYHIYNLSLSNNNFEDTVEIAFIYRLEQYLNNNTNLILHNLTDNDSVNLLLKNPL